MHAILNMSFVNWPDLEVCS